MRVTELLPIVGDAARISLEELEKKRREARKGLEQVDGEVSFHDEKAAQRLRDGEGAADDDQFLDVLTDFYNWASERQDDFETHLDEVTGSFGELAKFLGEEEVKEPTELFATLQKFLVRFEAIFKEVQEDEAGARKKKQQRTLKSRPQQKGGPRMTVARAPGVGSQASAAALSASVSLHLTAATKAVNNDAAGNASPRASTSAGADADSAGKVDVPQRRMSSSVMKQNSNAALMQAALSQRGKPKGPGT